MKRKLILAVICILAAGCTDNFKEGQEYLNQSELVNARKSFSRVQKDNENYEEAQNKIQYIDSIIEVNRIERQRQDSIAKVEREKIELEKERERYKKELDGMSDFDGGTYRGSVSSIVVEIALFHAWAKLINEGLEHSDSEIVNASKKMEAKAKSIQKKEFPKIRKEYGKLMKEEMWEQNIEVKTLGRNYTTLEFIGGIFASNKNKKDVMESLSDMLHKLRFKRVNYKWYKYDDEYTYYTLKSKDDTELIEN